MNALALSTLLALVLCISAARYEAESEKDKDFDGVGVGLVHRPSACDKTSKKGDLLKVHFNGTLGDGTVFDKRYMTRPLEFVLGDGEMIIGWDAGLEDMCVGEIRYLTIPPKYAYDEHGLGALPSRTNLHFFVTLLSIETATAARAPNTFRRIDSNNDGLLTKDEVEKYLQTTGVKDVPGQSGIKQMLRDIFLEEDKDKNGYITKVEFTGKQRDEL